MDLATKRYLAGDHLAAVDLLEKALAKDSAREDARALLVDVLMEYGSSLRLAGKYEDALAAFKRARKVMPANAQLMDLIHVTERFLQERGALAAPELAPPTSASPPVSPPEAGARAVARKAVKPVGAVPAPVSIPARSTAPFPAGVPMTAWWVRAWDPWALTALVLLLAVATFRWQVRLLQKDVARLSWEAEERRTEASRLREEGRGLEQALRAAEARAAAADEARRKAGEISTQAETKSGRLSALLEDARSELARREAAHRDEMAGLREALAMLRTGVRGMATTKGASAATAATFRREQAVLASLVVDVPGAKVEAARERTVSHARALYALNPSKALAFFRELAGGASAGARRTAAWIAGAVPLQETLALLERLAADSDVLVARESLKTLKQIAAATGPASAWPPALRPGAAEALARALSSGEWVV